MKTLGSLAALLPDSTLKGSPETEITAVAHDSRKVVPGTLFICLTGANTDGHEYAAQAAAAGAVAILSERSLDVTVPVLQVADTRQAMELIVPYFFDYPGKKLRMIGITGTNGKTTTTHMVRKIFLHAGHKIGLMGTIHSLIGDKILPAKNTTPNVVDLQAVLAEMVAGGMEYAVMEVSSHALALNRVAGCEFDVGIYSNITRDHLDFHKTFENYIAAKAKLFSGLEAEGNIKHGKTAVINVDDAAAPQMLAAATGSRIITYAVNKTADIKAENISIKTKGMSFDLDWQGERLHLDLKTTGIFNVYNVMAAVGAALGEKIPLAVIGEALEGFSGVPGRFELVEAGQKFSVIVDYAHTPDGLENILKTAQEFAKGRIIIVFGCGGDRDRTKRPIMGGIAAQYADVVIATSDNPRTEDPESILAEVEAGVRPVLHAGQEHVKITDRKSAIRHALEIAESDDVVLIAGKGHETYQILKDRTIDFDDRAVVREIIGEMK